MQHITISMRTNKIFILLLVLFSNVTAWSQVDCKMEIDKKHDTIYKRGEQIPYSGNYEEYYPGELKIKGNYLNGLKNGEFTYFAYTGESSHNEIDSIVNYKNGKKNGIKKTFDALDYPESFENYINDTIDGDCYYWYEGGQLYGIITYNKGKKIKIDTCQLVDTIHLIKCFIKGEKNGMISNNIFTTNDSLKVFLININDQEPYDTVPLSVKYKIISFKYRLWRFVGGDDIETSDFISYNGYIHNPRSFYFNGIEISNIYIENPCGQKYYLPSRWFRIKDYKKIIE
jgi:antitoxin component YwqK of YwqJK toxin-antitoxin module